jgi:hypothetical protein
MNFSGLIAGSCISDLSTSLFLKKLKSLFRIASPFLGFSRADISGIDPAWPFHLIFISYQLIFISFIHAIFCLFLHLQVFKNKLSLICSTFISTINLLHSILLFIRPITSSRTILFISFIFGPTWSKKVKVKSFFANCIGLDLDLELHCLGLVLVSSLTVLVLVLTVLVPSLVMG